MRLIYLLFITAARVILAKHVIQSAISLNSSSPSVPKTSQSSKQSLLSNSKRVSLARGFPKELSVVASEVETGQKQPAASIQKPANLEHSSFAGLKASRNQKIGVSAPQSISRSDPFVLLERASDRKSLRSEKKPQQSRSSTVRRVLAGSAPAIVSDNGKSSESKRSRLLRIWLPFSGSNSVSKNPSQKVRASRDSKSNGDGSSRKTDKNIEALTDVESLSVKAVESLKFADVERLDELTRVKRDILRYRLKHQRNTLLRCCSMVVPNGPTEFCVARSCAKYHADDRGTYEDCLQMDKRSSCSSYLREAQARAVRQQEQRAKQGQLESPTLVPEAGHVVESGGEVDSGLATTYVAGADGIANLEAVESQPVPLDLPSNSGIAHDSKGGASSQRVIIPQNIDPVGQTNIGGNRAVLDTMGNLQLVKAAVSKQWPVYIPGPLPPAGPEGLIGQPGPVVQVGPFGQAAPFGQVGTAGQPGGLAAPSGQVDTVGQARAMEMIRAAALAEQTGPYADTSLYPSAGPGPYANLHAGAGPFAGAWPGPYANPYASPEVARLQNPWYHKPVAELMVGPPGGPFLVPGVLGGRTMDDPATWGRPNFSKYAPLTMMEQARVGAGPLGVPNGPVVPPADLPPFWETPVQAAPNVAEVQAIPKDNDKFNVPMAQSGKVMSHELDSAVDLQ